MHQKYLVFVVVSLWPILGLAADQLPISAADTLALKSISEVAPSPDGGTIVFALGTIDLAANKTREQLMQIRLGGAEPEPVKGAPEGASSVRWSPEGSRIAFIAKSDKSNAIYTLEVASGKLTRVCEYRRSNAFLAHLGNMLAWSPDGRAIAFAGTLEPDPPVQDPLVVTRILYKTRTSFSDNRRTHIYVVAAAGGEPRALTSGTHDERHP